MDRELAIDLIRNSGLDDAVDDLIGRLRPSIRIRTQAVHAEPLHDSSKFGGMPLVPSDFDWPSWDATGRLMSMRKTLENLKSRNPRSGSFPDKAIAKIDEKLKNPWKPLAFLAQLKLAEVTGITRELGLPQSGRLLFFADHEDGLSGFDPASRGSAQVIYVPERPDEGLARPPEFLSGNDRFPPCVLNFSLEQTLPIDGRSYGLDAHVWDGEGPYVQLIKELTGDDQCVHRAGGYAEEIQGAMELECQLVTNGIWCGDASGYQDPRRKLLEPGAGDWRLLLQLDSDDNLKWMWGDAGRLYFWIRQRDLAETDFSNVWCIEQCY